MTARLFDRTEAFGHRLNWVNERFCGLLTSIQIVVTMLREFAPPPPEAAP